MTWRVEKPAMGSVVHVWSAQGCQAELVQFVAEEAKNRQGGKAWARFMDSIAK